TSQAMHKKASALAGIKVGDRPVGRDSPVLLTVVVVNGSSAARRNQLVTCRLHVTSLVRGPADEHRVGAIPRPRKQKPRMGDRQNRINQAGIRPRLAPVSADFDPCDASPTRPGDAAYLPWPLGGHHPNV